ncbi:molybdopterin-binding protein [Roseobacteraceae bacterium S113]
MTFGSIPLSEALGAILAHSVATPEGRLRKGLVLEAAHLDALSRAGLDVVTVARLAPGDVDENTAARALAQALVPDPQAQGLILQEAFTGRVNILAAEAGVVQLDAARLTALNDIDPMITLATVPAHQQMRPRGMVGTVKIISYGVPGDALAAACDVARAGLHLARPVLQTADLIVTEIPGGAGEKGVPAIAGRLEALQMTLAQTLRVPHEEDAIAQALEATRADLVLILTASATSDPHDVAPEALRAAGGAVTRFGMPVDPGNLLFLGNLGDRPVIGLPGCARAPALNGADWVLSRVVCGVPVSAQDIAGMGVGGLLKEIPTRPQPRRGKS